VDGRLLLSLDAALLTESIGVPDAELPAVLRAIDVLRGGDNDNGACRAACLLTMRCGRVHNAVTLCPVVQTRRLTARCQAFRDGSSQR
jgi:hypothetical protein